jgi:hypothetical protein
MLVVVLVVLFAVASQEKERSRNALISSAIRSMTLGAEGCKKLENGNDKQG